MGGSTDGSRSHGSRTSQTKHASKTRRNDATCFARRDQGHRRDGTERARRGSWARGPRRAPHNPTRAQQEERRHGGSRGRRHGRGTRSDRGGRRIGGTQGGRDIRGYRIASPRPEGRGRETGETTASEATTPGEKPKRPLGPGSGC